MAIKFNRRLRAKAVVDMAPMIDIVFQLVIFFMVATTFKTTTGMELTLPKAENLSPIAETPLKVVIIDRDHLVVGSAQIKFVEFDNLLSSITKTNSSERRSVVLYGDSKMEYALLIDIMDVLKDYGYDSIDLALGRKLK